MTPSNRSKFEQLLDTYEPKLRDAFLEAIADIRSQVTLKLLVERLERGDVQGALDVLQIERAAFGSLELALAEAYNAGGIGLASDLKLRDPDGNRVAFRFGVRNPEAERWLAEHSSTLVTRIVEDQRQGIRTALTEGLASGSNPRATALNVVGRISRVTGKREGGIIGLTSPQADQLAEVKRILADPEEIRRFFVKDEKTGEWKPRYKTTSRRWDRAILRAINNGKALAADDIAKISMDHSNRLMKLRADTLSLHETFTALSKAQADGMRQAIEAGKVDAMFVTKRWRHSGKPHPRHDHRRLNGTEVGYYEEFVMSDGTRMAYPHAPGAPVSQTLGCGCGVEYKVDYIGQLVAQRRAA